jgi:TonB family protein
LPPRSSRSRPWLMRRSSLVSLFLFIAIPLSGVFLLAFQNPFARAATQTETPQTEVVLTKLSPPNYPPLARQARITGDVKTHVAIRQDGSVDSAALFSGHPMLTQAAIDSAQKSQFECRRCSAQGSSYWLIYTFRFQDDGGCADVIVKRPTRSARCLYLWKCGVQSLHHVASSRESSS